VENRSEPPEWLADGSPGDADPAQDQPAGVKTALSTDAGPAGLDGPSPSPGLDDAGLDSARVDSARAGSNGAAGSAGLDAADPHAYNNLTNPWPAQPDSWPAPPAPSAAAPPPPAPAYTAGPSPVISPAAERPPFAPPPAARPRPAQPQQQSRPAPPRPAKAPQQQRPAQQSGAASIRKASLTIARVEPWSVMKFSFMMSLVGWVILFVAVAVTYFLLSKLGVFSSVEQTVGLVTAGKGHAGADASSWFSASRVLGYTMLVGAVNVILITALATVGAVLYNLVTSLAGGIEVTLKETD
jgi:hypothetical protein